ncbi:MAG: hypothetical protein AB1894_21105 [Chloroflexota bacterium]
MKALRRFWEDIRKGENIDLYIAVFASILLAILAISGLAVQSWIAPLNIAVLALLAYSMLGSRHRMDELFQGLREEAQSIFRKKWPEDDLDLALREAKNAFLIGVSLRRTFGDYYALLEDKLQRGDTVRILVLDPNSAAVEAIAKRVYKDVSIERSRGSIKDSLRSMHHLKLRTGGKLEIRVTDYPVTIGGILTDPNTTHGKLFLENYTYKMRDIDLPKILLQSKDEQWYEFYKSQMDTLWENGTAWEGEEEPIEV